MIIPWLKTKVKNSSAAKLQVANPCAAYRDELYDASRFTNENIAATATEKDRWIQTVENTGWDYNDDNSTWGTLRNHYSPPEAKAGVTISFWAQVPTDEEWHSIPNILA